MISEHIDDIIKKSIEDFDNSHFLDNEFEKLISFGELVDRLSIVNFKLYKLKDKIIEDSLSDEDKLRAEKEDIRLCEERSRLKTCLDEKVIYIIRKLKCDADTGFNAEVKRYGE